MTTKIDLALFNQQDMVSVLLDSWFRDDPASTQERYLRSALLDLRRRYHPDTGQVEDVIVPLGAPATPRWLPKSVLLPPCEADLLNWLFSGRLTVISSGTGSGKTSALSFIATLIRQLRREKKLERNNLLPVDIQSLNPDEYWPPEGEVDDPILLKKRFLSNVGMELDAVLVKRLGHEELIRGFCQVFLEERGSRVPETTLWSAKIGSLGYRLRAILRQTEITTETPWNVLFNELIPIGQHEDLSQITRSLSPSDLLEVRILALYQIAFQKSTLPTALVFDNVDNYPEYLQRALIDCLKGVTAQPFYINGMELRPPLTVSIFTRLSTAARHANSYGSHTQFRYFAAPEPVDLVFLRLSFCLVNAERDDGFLALDERDRSLLLNRSWFLWRNLLLQSQLRATLSARAGTNIRNAFAYTKRWLLSPRITSCPTVDSDYGSRIAHVLTAALLIRRFELAVNNVIGASRSKEVQPSQNREALEVIIEETILRLFRALDYAGRFTLVRGGLTHAEERDFRHKLWLFHDVALSDFLLKPRFREAIAACGRLLVDAISSLSGSPIELNEMRPALERALAQRNREEIDSPSSTGELIVKEIFNSRRPYTGQALDGEGPRIRYQPRLETLLRSLLEPIEAQRSQRTRIQLRLEERLPTNWLSASVMLAPDSILTRRLSDSVNLFSVSGHALWEVPLVIVAILYERRGVDTLTGFLRKELELRGFGDQQRQIDALRLMVRLDQRLLYSGVRDDRDGVEKWWATNDRDVHLSCAGSRYMSILTRIPAYIQWAMLEIAEIREQLGVDEDYYLRLRPLQRIDFVRCAFRVALSREAAFATERPDPERALFDGLRASLMPMTWCLFNSLPGFVDDVLANRKVSDAQSTAEEWLNLATECRDRFVRIFRTRTPVEWDESLLFADHAYQKLKLMTATRKPRTAVSRLANPGRSQPV